MQHFLQFICSIIACGLVVVSVFSLNLAFREGTTYLKRLHRIPCSGCAYFTGDYRLKCTLHPVEALTEEALECLDFEEGSCSNQSRSKLCNQP